MHEKRWRDSGLKQSRFMEVGVCRHKRSMSDPVKRKPEKHKLDIILEAPYQLEMEMGRVDGFAEAWERQPTQTSAQSSLNQEILKLQKQLQDQFAVRHAMEKALSYRPLSHDATIDNSVPKPTKELIKEVAVLELEIVYLERHLLSLYRKTFYEQMSSVSAMDGRSSSAIVTQKELSIVAPGQYIMPDKEKSVIQSSNHVYPQNSLANRLKECNDIWEPQKLLDSSIHRSHSSLSQRSACSIRTSPPRKSLNKVVDSYHSLPLSMLEQAQSATPNPNLEEHLDTYLTDNIPETPNCLSEEMIKCISVIYCELADPPLINQDYTSSPVAFSSSLYEVSSQGQHEKWSSRSRKLPFFNLNVNPFHFEGSEELSGPYCRMLKVHLICRDTEKLEVVEQTLQKFRSLVCRLEELDLRKMKHEEKLAFWINVHNALVMHAYLVYGIPQNNLKRVSLLLKAAYNVGGHTISVDMIQNSILGCRLPRPGQWLRMLFSSKTKFKVGDARKAYAIEHPEPLLHFALCSGIQSDPAVRIYTPKRVFEELETAKEEYIQSTLILHKEQKILLPKIVECFAKDSGMCSVGLAEMIERLMPDYRRKSIQQCQHKKNWKGIEWIPHNFTFQYLLSKEVAW
ncbi:hypothetical protein FEM48_Zijuj09G0112000 [Ziziphus jujuba var. spinosa]|uniref:Ternary complex factor MIP1, leucine-zipper n=1 Tax=Ziziphus jujuba var. spinosa TaxID=714518 RepID=A0A978USN9_ZIZJJ|nr:hypothetical protein FEM48_Zijuj09G0112000 [Ziziphus jujuba var. spinosa]